MIDLLGDTIWTDAQINRRVVDLIRQKYSENDELKLARIAIGQQRGVYTPTEAEEIEITTYQTHVLACRELGRRARAENDLLRQAIEYERAKRRLLQAPLDPAIYPDVPKFDGKGDQVGTTTHPELIRDAKERARARKVIDTMTDKAVLALIEKRAVARGVQEDLEIKGQ